MSAQQTRRSFFSYAAAAVAVTQQKPLVAANDKVDVAIIGLGGRGQSHMNVYAKLPEANIVALCDVNQAALERGQALIQKLTGKTPKGYVDMRQVFDDKSVEAVSMPVPNHWHALATIWACQAGKDVYIEKPACWNVFEGQQMIAAARKYNRMVQVGSQSRSMPHKIKAMGLLHDGVIGKVYLAKGLCFKRRLSIGHMDDAPTPPGLDWDKFLGPAPMRPYNQLRFAYNWHWFWDTGNGDIGNQGIHEMDVARWGLNRGLPQSVSSTGGKYYVPANDDQETPNTQMASFNYGDAEIMFEVRGALTGPEGGLQIRGGNTIGDLFYGSDGWMAVDAAGFQVYKARMDGKIEKQEKIMDEVKAPGDDTAPHMSNFLAAVKSRDYKSLTADIEIAVASADLCHLANTSYRLKRTLRFDEATRKYVGDEEANRMLTRNPYRKPYVVPEKV
jgi:predicted dehydrogenase